MITRIKETFLGTINNVEFDDSEVFHAAVVSIHKAETELGLENLSESATESIKRYIENSKQNQVSMRYIKGTLSAIASLSSSEGDLINRLLPTKEYGRCVEKRNHSQ